MMSGTFEAVVVGWVEFGLARVCAPGGGGEEGQGGGRRRCVVLRTVLYRTVLSRTAHFPLRSTPQAPSLPPSFPPRPPSSSREEQQAPLSAVGLSTFLPPPSFSPSSPSFCTRSCPCGRGGVCARAVPGGRAGRAPAHPAEPMVFIHTRVDFSARSKE